MGSSFGIEKLKEVSTIVSSVSTVTDNNTKLRVYDVSGRYIPVKDLSKLPAGAYINGSLKFEITAKRLYAASQRVL